MHFALARVAQWVGVSPCRPKGLGFDSRSGRLPGLWVRFSVKDVREATNPLSSLTSVFFPPPFPYLKSVNLSSGEDKILIIIK